MAVRPGRGPVVDDDVALARPFLKAGAPTSYAAGPPVVPGDYAGEAPKGALLIDTDGGDLFINAGSKAQPAWKKVTRDA